MPGRLARSGRSFPALDDALQLAQHRPSTDSHLQQDEDALLRSQWSIQAVPDLASKKQDVELLRKWLSVSQCPFHQAMHLHCRRISVDIAQSMRPLLDLILAVNLGLDLPRPLCYISKSHIQLCYGLCWRKVSACVVTAVPASGLWSQ